MVMKLAKEAPRIWVKALIYLIQSQGATQSLHGYFIGTNNKCYIFACMLSGISWVTGSLVKHVNALPAETLFFERLIRPTSKIS